MIISGSVLLRMRNVSDKIIEKIKTHILCLVTVLFFFENLTIYEIMWENILQGGGGRPQMSVWRMRVACWITKGTQNMYYFVLFHCNRRCKNAPQCYFTRTLLLLLIITRVISCKCTP